LNKIPILEVPFAPLLDVRISGVDKNMLLVDNKILSFVGIKLLFHDMTMKGGDEPTLIPTRILDLTNQISSY
jgi:hypothetical protein